MSPEYRYLIWIKNNFSYEKSDIFSLGLIILRLNFSNINKINKIENGEGYEIM